MILTHRDVIFMFALASLSVLVFFIEGIIR